MTQELRLRIVFGIILASVVLATTWFGGVGFRLLSVLIGLLVFHEWLAMGRARDAEKLGISNHNRIALSAGWAVIVCISICAFLGFYVLALSVGTISAGAFLVLAQKRPMPFWFAGGILYAAAIIVSLSAIRDGGREGLYAMLFVFAVVWTTDIMAYFVGRAVGGPKLAPAISPGKTWSGAIGGTVFSVLAGQGVCVVFSGVPSASLLVLAFALSAISQVGDLFESFLKRRCGVKDSSQLIPGHGGVMDRVDGLAAAAVFLFFVVFVAQMASNMNNLSVGDLLGQWSGGYASASINGV